MNTDVNIRLGKRIKDVLLFLYQEPGHMRRQEYVIRTINELYDYEKSKRIHGDKDHGLLYPLPIPRTLRVSYSRAFSRLEEEGLIYRYNYKYKYEYKGQPLYTDYSTGEQVRTEPKPTKTWTSKPWFGITDKGVLFVNTSVQLTTCVNNK